MNTNVMADTNVAFFEGNIKSNFSGTMGKQKLLTNITI